MNVLPIFHPYKEQELGDEQTKLGRGLEVR
jgi:hypothetical protein